MVAPAAMPAVGAWRTSASAAHASAFGRKAEICFTGISALALMERGPARNELANGSIRSRTQRSLERRRDADRLRHWQRFRLQFAAHEGERAEEHGPDHHEVTKNWHSHSWLRASQHRPRGYMTRLHQAISES